MAARKLHTRLAVVELERRDVPTFLGNQLFPLDNPWNQKITNAPVASNSAAIIGYLVNTKGNRPVHPDFGNPPVDQALYGIPITVVDNTTPLQTIYVPNGSGGIGYPGESDLVPVPIPSAEHSVRIEGDPYPYPANPSPALSLNRGDSHLLIYNRDTNVLYELYQAIRPSETQFPYGGTKPNTTQWGAWQISLWDLNQNTFRTVGDTSADAAGLPILPGLVRPDEALPVSAGGQGVIDHAIRFTVQHTRNAFVYPASHFASSRTGTDLPRMGERFRLRADFPIPASWTPEAKAVAQAMKDYGLIVADNGSDMYFQGVPSVQWNMDGMLALQNGAGRIRASDFEVVDLTPRVTSLSVTSGLPAGGTTVTITGQNFSGAAGRMSVLFGTTPAASFTIVSDTRIDAVAPAHALGTVSIRVQSGKNEINNSGNSVFWGYGTSADTAADDFTYTNLGPPPPPTPIPGTLAFTQSARSVGEGAGAVTFTVTRTGGADGAITVQFATANGTAIAPGDYTATSGTLSWANGETASKTITVTILDDAANEPDETFTLALTNATGGASLGTVATATVTIADNDPPPSAGALQFTQSSVTVGEAAGTVTFTVSRTGGSAGAVSVQFATSNGSATAGTDYTSTSGTLSWADGETASKTFTVAILDDADDEPDETFAVALSNATGGASLGGATSATATITDNDAPALPPPPPPPPPAPTGQPFAVGTDRGTVATVTMYNPDGSVRWTARPFGDSFTGGVRVATADVTGDGVADVVAGSGPGIATRVRVYDGTNGAPVFDVAPFEAAFTGGVYVAAGEITGDGRAEFVVTPDEGGGPRVQVYDGNGFARIADFFGIDDPDFRGGARAAIGDVNGDGRGDLLVSAGFMGGPRVAGFDGLALSGGTQTHLFPDFFAFEQSVRNGVFIAGGDLDGDGFAEVITGGGPGGGPRVSAFGGRQLIESGAPVRQSDFFAGDSANRGGVRVAAVNLNGDARADLLAGSGSDGGSRVTAYTDVALGGTQTPSSSFDAVPGFAGGVFVG